MWNVMQCTAYFFTDSRSKYQIDVTFKLLRRTCFPLLTNYGGKKRDLFRQNTVYCEISCLCWIHVHFINRLHHFVMKRIRILLRKYSDYCKLNEQTRRFKSEIMTPLCEWKRNRIWTIRNWTQQWHLCVDFERY